MTTRGSARLRNGVGDLRQSDAREGQARQGEEARWDMHSAWCWAVMRERMSRKASWRAELDCWDGSGWQRKVGTGCVWEMLVVEAAVWMLKRKRVGVVVLAEEAAIMVRCRGA